jgi:site-specific recombinase XerD
MLDDTLLDFGQVLAQNGVKPLMVARYLSDIQCFATWFTVTKTEDFVSQGITVSDVRSFLSHLVIETRYKATKVYRILNTLCWYCAWAKKQGLLQDDPTEELYRSSKSSLRTRRSVR